MSRPTRILVMKFGGSSVATAEARDLVYRRIIAAHQDGYAVVAVISAMGRRGAPYATDTLLDLIQSTCPDAQTRERDLIFSCGEIIAGTVITANLQQRGCRATYLTGPQAGVITTGEHGDAHILRIEPDHLRALLASGAMVIVAGGQGVTPQGEITTLGRGGSDTTACALGVALDAERIEIYTDVDGLMTADPHLVPEAKLITNISHRGCCLLASHGAKVMHPRSVETAAQKPAIPLWVRSTFGELPGTLIGEPFPGSRVASHQARPLAVAVHSGRDGVSCVSLVGEGLTVDPKFASAFVDRVTRTGSSPLATKISDQVASAWVEDGQLQAVARSVHELVTGSWSIGEQGFGGEVELFGGLTAAGAASAE